MKILVSPGSVHFSDTFPAGETQIAYGFLSRLARMGHEVTVFSPRVTLSRNVDGIRAVELGSPGGRHTDGRYASSRFLWWRFSLLARREAKKLIRGGRVDVIHHLMPAHEGKFSLLTGLGVPFVYGPMLLTWGREAFEPQQPATDTRGFFEKLREALRDKFADRLDMHLGEHLFRKTLKGADTIMISSAKLKHFLGPEHTRRLVPLQYGVDTSIFQPNGDSPGPIPVVLFLGLLARRKGIQDLVRAFSILKGRVRAKLVIVGGGDVAGVQRLVSDLGVDDSVEIVGQVPNTEVAGLIRKCTIFCLPSHGEPFGMVLLQAMASGKPVVATSGGGVDEIIENGKSGILVEQKRPAELAAAIKVLLGDPELRRRLGSSGRRRAVDEFDWDVMTGKLVSIYENVIERHKSGGPACSFR